MGEIRDYEIAGNPTPEERRVVIAALERLLEDERTARVPSRWKIEGRVAALGAGLQELRHRFTDRAWDLSTRMNWQAEGRRDLRGRGDAK